jgi:hypothetical protein
MKDRIKRYHRHFKQDMVTGVSRRDNAERYTQLTTKQGVGSSNLSGRTTYSGLLQASISIPSGNVAERWLG